jgi:membrane peptidoglycan carboxypeptidase
MEKLKKTTLTLSIIILIITGIYLSIYLYAMTLPKLDISTANSLYLYDDQSNLFSGKDNWIKLKDISKNMINATIAIEDKNFYKHKGFDFPRIIKAFYTNLTNKKTLQGASTISQQYIKNLFLNFDKTWNRKIEEAWLTIRLETHYKKDEILEGYLNTINYGGIFGIENASHYYFNKSASELTLAEASILAGIPKNPSIYSPIVNEKNAKDRQKLTLKLMRENKYITKEEQEKAYSEKLNYYGIEEKK